MKIHILTIGQPKFQYAKLGWDEYYDRLRRYHTVRTTHLADKYADDAGRIIEAAGNAYTVVLEITGKNLSSEQLAGFLETLAMNGREACFIIGGPEGLPQTVRNEADYRLSLSSLTFPHDLAMVMLAEALYRASSINHNQHYHK